jgi:hypothetical protein
MICTAELRNEHIQREKNKYGKNDQVKGMAFKFRVDKQDQPLFEDKE